MGEFADYANDEQVQSLEDLLDYESGNLSKHEAMESGVLDEDGSIPTKITTWGVHDVNSLLNELAVCESTLMLLDYKPKRVNRKTEQVWVSGGSRYKPSEMTTLHLKNAINYAKRMKMISPVVDALKAELRLRLN
jgi:hypothetical protein